MNATPFFRQAAVRKRKRSLARLFQIVRNKTLLPQTTWPFEIVGLYIWLVLAALPCLLALHFLGWRPLLALSWAAYLWYCIAPQQLTASEFESVFPILAWQLLFVHGITIGYHHKTLAALRDRCPKPVPVAIACASVAFMARRRTSRQRHARA